MPFQDDMSLYTKAVYVELMKKPRTAINKLNYIYMYIKKQLHPDSHLSRNAVGSSSP